MGGSEGGGWGWLGVGVGGEGCLRSILGTGTPMAMMELMIVGNRRFG